MTDPNELATLDVRTKAYEYVQRVINPKDVPITTFWTYGSYNSEHGLEGDTSWVTPDMLVSTISVHKLSPTNNLVVSPVLISGKGVMDLEHDIVFDPNGPYYTNMVKKFKDLVFYGIAYWSGKDYHNVLSRGRFEPDLLRLFDAMDNGYVEPNNVHKWPYNKRIEAYQGMVNYFPILENVGNGVTNVKALGTVLNDKAYYDRDIKDIMVIDMKHKDGVKVLAKIKIDIREREESKASMFANKIRATYPWIINDGIMSVAGVGLQPGVARIPLDLN